MGSDYLQSHFILMLQTKQLVQVNVSQAKSALAMCKQTLIYRTVMQAMSMGELISLNLSSLNFFHGQENIF